MKQDDGVTLKVHQLKRHSENHTRFCY